MLEAASKLENGHPVPLTDQERRLEQNKARANKLLRQAMREVLKVEEKLEELDRSTAAEEAEQISEDMMFLSKKIRGL